MARTHLVGDGADPADAGRDVGDLGDGTTPQERLEKPWGLEDAELDVIHPPIAQWMVSAPSPSTRAIAATRMVRVLGRADPFPPWASSGD